MEVGDQGHSKQYGQRMTDFISEVFWEHFPFLGGPSRAFEHMLGLQIGHHIGLGRQHNFQMDLVCYSLLSLASVLEKCCSDLEFASEHVGAEVAVQLCRGDNKKEVGLLYGRDSR